MVKRQRIKRRKRFFVGCEGESEQGYIAFLQRLADENGLAIHLDARVVSNAGNPLVLVQQSLIILENGEKNGRSAYSRQFLLLDTDLIGQDQARDRDMFRLANDNELVLVRQNPCFEAVLLRHVASKETHNPPTSSESMRQLKTEWPRYKKGIAGKDLAEKFNLNDVRRAAAQPIQCDLRNMLLAIGLSHT